MKGIGSFLQDKYNYCIKKESFDILTKYIICTTLNVMIFFLFWGKRDIFVNIK